MTTPGITINLTQRDKSLLEAFPEAVVLSSPQGDILAVNVTAECLFQDRREALIGNPVSSLIAEGSRDWYMENCVTILHGLTDSTYAEVQCCRKDGGAFLAEVGYGLVKEGESRSIINTFRDIAQKQKEQIEEALEMSAARLNSANTALLRIARSQNLHDGNLEDLFCEMTERVSRILQVARVSIWLYTEGYAKLVCQTLFDLNANKYSSGDVLSSINYPNYFKALTEGRFIAADDARADPRTSEYIEDYLIPNNIHSILDAPVRIGGRMVGVVCLEHTGTPRVWTPEEQTFIGSLSDMVSIALEASERVKTQQQLELLNQELEQRVLERTEQLNSANRLLELELAQRERVEQALQQSQESLKHVTDSLPVIVFQFTFAANNEKRLAFMNNNAEDLLGLLPEQLQNDFQSVARLLHPDDAERVGESVRQAMSDFEKWKGEFRIILPDGKVRWIRVNAMPRPKTGDGQTWNGVATDITNQKNSPS